MDERFWASDAKAGVSIDKGREISASVKADGDRKSRDLTRNFRT